MARHMIRPVCSMVNWMKNKNWKTEALLVLVFTIFSLALYFVPTGYEERTPQNAIRCRGKIASVDNSETQLLGMIRKGHQQVLIDILDGPYAGKQLEAHNQLLGRMDIDKLYKVGDEALVVLSLNENGEIMFVNPQDHYRIGLELILLVMFGLLLLSFGGWTGVKALLSFIFAGMMIWKILIPMLLEGWDPVILSLIVVALLTGTIIFLVAGLNRKGLTAFLGAFAGVLTSSLMALYFSHAFHMHGAVMPFAETLLYSGYGHLDLTKIYVAAVFIAASGAVMDLAMDVAASMYEVVEKKPDISRVDVMKSGFTVGRAVVGTMTTTLLLAYSGGYITLLMAFMAQGVPLANLFNMIYVAAEILKTLVGSFGLVTVAPFTAIIGSFILTGNQKAHEISREENLGLHEPARS